MHTYGNAPPHVISNLLAIDLRLDTVNVDIFAQYIFSRISRRMLDARKYDVSEKINPYRANKINYYMRENMSTRKCH